MVNVRDSICKSIQEHNNFIPVYNTLLEPYKVVTDYEIGTTLYREDKEPSIAYKEALHGDKCVKIGEIGPVKSYINGIDYIEVYITSDNNYLTKRINKK